MHRKLALAKGQKKEDIIAYRHEAETRKNAVPVGLASYDTSKPKPKKYDYDPHLDPVRKHAPLFMISYKTIFERCSISVSNGVDPQLVRSGEKEHTSFEVPTVSLHIHDRIAPEAIIRLISRKEGRELISKLLLFEVSFEDLK